MSNPDEGNTEIHAETVNVTNEAPEQPEEAKDDSSDDSDTEGD